MVALYRTTDPKTGRMTEKADREWQRGKKRQDAIRKKINSLYDKRRKAKDKSETKKQQANKRINGYGEATKREITSTTYERAQKRTQSDFNNYFGRGM